MSPKRCFSPSSLVTIFLISLIPAFASTQPASLIVKPIDETRRVTLHGNIHPLAQARYDAGAVPDSFLASRVLLMLNRPPDREAALQKFLIDVHRRSAPSYHHWLTPQQFGDQFGPSGQDVQTTVNWLKSHGFQVPRVSKSKCLIEFSGTAGQLREAFQAQIHQYKISGETHYANASALSVPEALAPIIHGLSPLNDFRAQPQVAIAGPAVYSRSTKRAIPQWTISNPFGTPNPYAYPVAPEDFATQYDLNPVYQSGLNGSGQTIGIINESNIDLSLVSDYQQLFGLPNNPTQLVIDGNDPGTINGVDIEAYLDVELSAAVAPAATVNLYISNGSDLSDPLALAALRAVEDNQASVLSVSFGSCEQGLGEAGNQFWSSLWEQAAAQGQTVFVASGDSGPYCNYLSYMAVSGIASTPWNVAVGGTDFYYSDYATGGASATTLWNPANDSNLGSLIASLPEQAWNDGFGLDIISNGLQRNEVAASGGGVSNCTTQDPSTNQCTGGYPKPTWQNGPGVAADNARDIPDVSLYASNGANLSAYPICALEGECAPGSGDQTGIFLVGGTSASSPAMAGIMALVDQKYGRQGQADFTLYSLAQQVPSAFHDVTLGSTDSPCASGMTDCALSSNGFYATTIFPATSGYDMATGLGSVDANVLINSWNSISYLPSATSLTLSAGSVTHGTPVTATVKVTPQTGTGTPTGDAAILTNSLVPQSQGQTFITLKGGTGDQSVDFFPGGTYDVTAQYGGDAVYGPSASAPVALHVTPEPSNINFSVLANSRTLASGGSVTYEAPLSFVIQPIGISAPAGKTNGNATGTATFRVDSTSATVPLNSIGLASWNSPALAIGNHTASASYSGDASFNASRSKSFNFVVGKGFPFVTAYVDNPLPTSGLPEIDIYAGNNFTLTVEVGPEFGPAFGQSAALGTATPTGTVTVCLGSSISTCNNAVYTQTVPLTPVAGTYAQYATATITFVNPAVGYYSGAISYNGDANWQAIQFWDLQLESINVIATPSLAPSNTTLSVTPQNISGAGVATLTTTIAGSGTLTPSGEVDFYDNGLFLAYFLLGPPTTGSSDTVSFGLSANSFFNNGNNQITAIYDGDSNYLPSVSNVVALTTSQVGGDFALGPQLPQITVPAGGSKTVSVNLTSINNFNATVSLSCASPSAKIGCSISPNSPAVNGATTAMLTITATSDAAQLSKPNPFGRIALAQFSELLFGFLLVGSTRRRIRRYALCSVICLWVLLTLSCGGGGNKTNEQQQITVKPSNMYSVLVTGTANGITHNAKILVAVQ